VTVLGDTFDISRESPRRYNPLASHESHVRLDQGVTHLSFIHVRR
jgi:hypothetical protein